MWKVYSYNWIEGHKTLVAWQHGINKSMAIKFFNEQSTAGLAMIEMTRIN